MYDNSGQFQEDDEQAIRLFVRMYLRSQIAAVKAALANLGLTSEQIDPLIGVIFSEHRKAEDRTSVSLADIGLVRSLGQIWLDQQGANATELNELARIAVKIGAAIMELAQDEARGSTLKILEELEADTERAISNEPSIKALLWIKSEDGVTVNKIIDYFSSTHWWVHFLPLERARLVEKQGNRYVVSERGKAALERYHETATNE